MMGTMRMVDAAGFDTLLGSINGALDALYTAAPDVGVAFTCSEAESIADLFRAADREADAEQWIEFHSRDDDEGDLHYSGDDEDGDA